MSARDWLGFALLLTLIALALLQSGLESVARHVPRRPVRQPRPVPRHAKPKRSKVLAGEGR